MIYGLREYLSIMRDHHDARPRAGNITKYIEYEVREEREVIILREKRKFKLFRDGHLYGAPRGTNKTA